jgi:uncharacterized iron-regulated membrane protein
MIRKVIFWTHLSCGVTAGLVVLMMSVTGVLLTFERQIVAWADHGSDATPAVGEQRRPLEELIDAARLRRTGFDPLAVTVRNDPRAPVVVAAGRAGTLYVNPYTAAVSEPGAQRLRAFFGVVEGWHRWFNVQGAGRATARAITGASSFAFLFLVLSGMYLWLPRVFKWVAFRARLVLNAKAATGKARDFNWHHVFGIWSALPLAVVVASAVVFSYPWANDLVYRSVGEAPPVRGGPRGGPPGPPGGAGLERDAKTSPSAVARLPYDALFERAAAQAGEWTTLTMNLPGDTATARFSIDQGNGGQPQRRHTLVLDAVSGDVDAWQPFSSQSAGQKTRIWIRFLHTGEALGIVGQTIAGVVSATTILMVWTGLALAYRRLLAPVFGRKPNRRGAGV